MQGRFVYSHLEEKTWGPTGATLTGHQEAERKAARQLGSSPHAWRLTLYQGVEVRFRHKSGALLPPAHLRRIPARALVARAQSGLTHGPEVGELGADF